MTDVLLVVGVLVMAAALCFRAGYSVGFSDANHRHDDPEEWR